MGYLDDYMAGRLYGGLSHELSPNLGNKDVMFLSCVPVESNT